jgi:CMP-N-acetylneuraminic acid synthetase/mannose-6-phosphate isomerase-like protein (cupin superfamily)
MKTVAYIPVSESTGRVPNRHTFLVDGHPMISYIVRACKKSGMFDEIVVDSDSELLKRMVNQLECQFLQRPPRQRDTKESRLNEALEDSIKPYLDFRKSRSGDLVVLVSPNFPLLTSETIRSFVEEAKKNPSQALLSREKQDDDWSEWKAALASGSVQWSAHPTATSFPISKIESLEAFSMDEMKLIEGQLVYQRQKYQLGAFKLPKVFKSIEHELEGLMERDGVATFHDSGINVRKSNIQAVKDKMGKAPWCYFLFYTATDQTALICQAPGEGARTHSHVTHDEWWVVVEGQFEWRLGDGSVMVGNPGDILFLPRGTVHTIVCTSKTDGIRLACGARDMEHIYF